MYEMFVHRLYDWNTMARRDVQDILKAQAANTQLEFEQRTKEVVLQFAQQVSTFLSTLLNIQTSVVDILI